MSVSVLNDGVRLLRAVEASVRNNRMGDEAMPADLADQFLMALFGCMAWKPGKVAEEVRTHAAVTVELCLRVRVVSVNVSLLRTPVGGCVRGCVARCRCE